MPIRFICCPIGQTVTFRCSIEVYISYWKPNKSFYMKLAA
ncbi:hypothetical protein HMPREF0973_02021 [Prevotella veroralis F0319]|uniref:Uncharacterized protein n=1 Tax=Prevotella veroralis F0319 TaxID=649761 RepID=C9MQX2_9BACT|nr:hypothetical protein HMPREF0973_02663 [Prevotella veroralis F0319]EEX18236.1 hypothetical protein HMPREF0973_02021 [Prevotella veroralis F0319]